MTDNFSQIKLRLPKFLKEQLTSWAKQQKRSLNTEIVNLLEKALEKENFVASRSEESLALLLSQITQRAMHFANREVILDALSANEKVLLEKLDTLPTLKKEKLLKAFISLLDSI